MNLTKTTLPEQFSQKLNSDGWIFDANYCTIIANISFAAVGDLLRKAKSKAKPAAFVVKSATNEFVCAAIVKYRESSDQDHPEGNWEYVWTFDENDVEDTFNIMELSNKAVEEFFIRRAGSSVHMMEYFPGALFPIHFAFFSCLRKWLEDNVKDGEETEIELADCFNARSGKEDGATVLSLEVLGKYVQLIKDDAELEVPGL